VSPPSSDFLVPHTGRSRGSQPERSRQSLPDCVARSSQEMRCLSSKRTAQRLPRSCAARGKAWCPRRPLRDLILAWSEPPSACARAWQSRSRYRTWRAKCACRNTIWRTAFSTRSVRPRIAIGSCCAFSMRGACSSAASQWMMSHFKPASPTLRTYRASSASGLASVLPLGATPGARAIPGTTLLGRFGFELHSERRRTAQILSKAH